MISLQDLRIDYDGTPAVQDLSLHIGAGEIYGLIGPNGAGKTSTIRVLATLLEPTYGEVRIGGIDPMLDPRGARALLGYMPDWAPVYADLKLWEFVDLFAAAHGFEGAARRERVAVALDQVGLAAKAETLAGTLSRGMKQRLVLAKTLLHDPAVLLLDEPASGLDPRARIELRDILKALVTRGKAVLISSHILTELADFCTGVGIMEKGRMVVSGSVEEITRQMAPDRTLIVEIVSGAEHAPAVLEAAACVLHWEGEQRLQLRFEGDAEAMAGLLETLVQAGVRVQAYYEEHLDLEDIFLRVGAREVS